MILQDPERREIDALLAILPEQSSVVEIGCGDGRLTLRYADRVRSVLAVDPDESAIAVLRSAQPPPNVTPHAAGIDRLDLKDQSADVVLLSWSL